MGGDLNVNFNSSEAIQLLEYWSEYFLQDGTSFYRVVNLSESSHAKSATIVL